MIVTFSLDCLSELDRSGSVPSNQLLGSLSPSIGDFDSYGSFTPFEKGLERPGCIVGLLVSWIFMPLFPRLLQVPPIQILVMVFNSK